MLAFKRVMVTGASGKLGGTVCAALVREGYEVIAVNRHSAVGVPGVEEVRADVADRAAMEGLVARSDAVIHLATCKEDRGGFVRTSVQGTFNILDAIAKSGAPKRFILASGDAVNGIYFNRQPVPINEDAPLIAYPGYYPLSKVIEETMTQQYHYQQGLNTVILRISWIHAEDDILSHLTVADPQFGVPVWRELMNDAQRAKFDSGRDALVAVRHPDGRPMLRHVVAVEDCVQAFLLALRCDNIGGQTFMIAMNDPFNYVDAAAYAARKLNLETVDLVDPIGQDFCIDVAKARYVLGYRPQYDVYTLIDKAIQFRRSGEARRARTGFKG